MCLCNGLHLVNVVWMHVRCKQIRLLWIWFKCVQECCFRIILPIMNKFYTMLPLHLYSNKLTKVMELKESYRCFKLNIHGNDTSASFGHGITKRAWIRAKVKGKKWNHLEKVKLLAKKLGGKNISMALCAKHQHHTLFIK